MFATVTPCWVNISSIESDIDCALSELVGNCLGAVLKDLKLTEVFKNAILSNVATLKG